MLDIRIFEESTKKIVYNRQTEMATKNTLSNCPLCASGDNANKTRIYKISEMDADHVTAWSKVEVRPLKTAKCCAKRTIELRVIDKI